MLTLFLTLLFSLPIGILDAYVIRDMWLWFAVPALAVNPITVVQAFGLNLLVQAFIRRIPIVRVIIGIRLGFLFSSLVTWFIGYIVHSYF